MKKNYNQPLVEATELQATALMQAASPGIGIGSSPIDPGEGGD